jgi:hypothetical protein
MPDILWGTGADNSFPEAFNGCPPFRTTLQALEGCHAMNRASGVGAELR